jgi:hypothetical protein
MFKKLFPIFFFALIYFASIAHGWFDDSITNKSNWILFNYRPMTDAWNVGYICEQVIKPILMVIGVDLILKRSIGENFPKIYKIEWTIFKLFILLNSISYFLWFRDSDNYQWIFWIMGIAATYLWCRKDNCNENNNKDE